MCVIWLPLRLLTKSSLVISALFGDEDCFYPKSMRFGFDSFSQSQHAQTNSHGLCLRIASNIWETSLSLDLFCCGFELYSGVWKRDLPLFAWTVGHLGRCQQRLIHFWCQGCIRGRDLVGQEFTDNIYMIAWHSYRHPPCSVSHFWQNFSWNVMKCLHIKQWGMGMKRFASLLHLYPMSYWSVGWAWASKVTWNRLRLRVGMPEGWGFIWFYPCDKDMQRDVVYLVGPGGVWLLFRKPRWQWKNHHL